MGASVTASPGHVGFGVFEADLQAGELRKNGARVKLEGQPFQVLALLLQRPGQVVTREELQQKLWPADTFVDFEHSINAAVKRLRDALDDSADSPHYIETLPRRGYRFIYPINGHPAATVQPAALPAPWWRQIRVMAPSVSALALAALLLVSNVAGLRDRLLGRPAPGEIKAIAVLPLRNISGDANQDYFASGITEMLITEFGRVAGLRVPSHQTVLQFADTKKPLPQIARELQVDALIEGTVLRAGNRVRITINFVQVQPERHLLSEKYDRDLSDVLWVQDDVTRAVANRIRASLTPELQRHFAKSRPLDPEVNEAYIKGLFLSGPGRGRETYASTPDRDRAKAYEYFQQVVQKAPDFAPAYARMALLDAHGGGYRRAGGEGHQGRVVRAQVRQLARKALELDDTQAEAHVALAWIDFSDWDFEGAEREFKRAIELNPNLAVARIWYVSYLMCLRRFEEAEAQGEVALRLNPASADVLTHVANNYLFSGRVDKAVELYRKALDLEPDYGGGHWGLGRAYYVQGKYQESVAELEKAIADRGRSFQNLALIAAAYFKGGRRKEGLEVLREMEGRWKQRGGGGSGTGAIAYIGLGDKDKAFDRLETAFERGGTYLIALLADPVYEPLRSDPRFYDLARRIGFPPDALRRASIPPEGLAPASTIPATSGGKSGKE